MEDGLLRSESPDYLILSALANESLKTAKDHVLIPTANDLERMRKRIVELLEKKNLERLLVKFDGRLDSFVTFASSRVEARMQHEKIMQDISLKEPNAEIRIENLVDGEQFPPDFVYVTVSTEFRLLARSAIDATSEAISAKTFVFLSASVPIQQHMVSCSRNTLFPRVLRLSLRPNVATAKKGAASARTAAAGTPIGVGNLSRHTRHTGGDVLVKHAFG